MKDRVFSWQAQRRVQDIFLEGELAYDENDFARTTTASWDNDPYRLAVTFRDIDKEFTTITGRPSNRGEIGGNIDFGFDVDALDFSSNLNFYKERFLPSEEDPDALNFDFSTTTNVPLGSKARWISSTYYDYTPGELSPRKNFRYNSNVTRRF